MGEWGRQAKRADYALVAALASEGLRTESKDLWLAAWYGEALLHVEGCSALQQALMLLLEMQREFWPTLYPEVEDGDLALRAAPLHWALERYAVLIYQIPFAEDGARYAEYKALRAGGRWEQGQRSLEEVEAAVARSSREFYAEASAALARSQAALEQLYLFCEEHYGHDGPSFVALRAALEEVTHAMAQTLRQKPGREAIGGPAESPTAEETEPADASVAAPIAAEASRPAANETDVPVKEGPEQALQFRSWEKVQQAIEASAEFALAQQEQSAATLWLALALSSVEAEVFGTSDPAPPSSQSRLALKDLYARGEWQNLLVQTLALARLPTDTPWLDLYRYLHTAASMQGALGLERAALQLVRGWLAENSALGEALFQDDTPVANADTREWLRDFVLEQQPAPAASPQIVQRAAQVPQLDDAYEQARLLMRQGALGPAARLLTEDTADLRSGRAAFLRRMALCRLLVEAGAEEAARRVLKQMWAEAGARELETWEDPSLLGELLVMLIRTCKHDAEEREELLLRLCQIQPALALEIGQMA